MGFYVAADAVNGDGLRFGTNGAQALLMGYLFAAYAVAGQQESNRVCAWVRPYGHRRRKMGVEIPWPERNKPSSVAALIAFSADEDGDGISECGYCVSADETIELGIKMKKISDPLLDDLVFLWREANRSDDVGRLDAARTARLSAHLELLVPLLRSSESWYPVFEELLQVVSSAARTGSGLLVG